MKQMWEHFRFSGIASLHLDSDRFKANIHTLNPNYITCMVWTELTLRGMHIFCDKPP